MEEDEAVEIGVEGLEMFGFVEGVVVFDIRADFQFVADAVFDDGSVRVTGRSFGEGKFSVPVCHAFGPDEYEVELDAWEDVG